MSFVPPESMVPLFRSGPGAESADQGRLTAFDTTSMANSVDIGGQAMTDLPILASAVPEITVPCTVVLIRFGSTWVIVGRVRVPAT